jgi:hypothetical protein
MNEGNQDEKKEQTNKVQETQEEKQNPIDEAKKVLEETKKATELMREERKLLEESKAKAILAGRAEAGSVPPKPKEETPKEYAERVMRGDFNK